MSIEEIDTEKKAAEQKIIEQRLLKHFLAAIAYRTQKALRGAPESFAGFSAGNYVRTPHELLWHMTGVLGYARTFFLGGIWQPDKLESFAAEIARFHQVLEALGTALEEERPVREISMDQLLQGPLADAMTHAGQLALLRRLAGSPVPPENFVRATITANNLGADQPAPVAPDPGWSPDLPPPAPGKNLPKDW
ncbi:MAG TPA: hypothetical protein VFF39_14865 [Verrucomicrobiae bacterium]|jgi:hypothetical protein|nr:hypothetical protein [Verrucomicrobiae bacterium]